MADLLFDWLGFSCFAYIELMIYKHGPIPTSQTGGQPLSVFSEKQELFLYRASRLSAKPELRRQRRLRVQQDEGAVRLRL